MTSITAPATADLVDDFPDEVSGTTLQLRLLGRRTRACGEVTTLRVSEDNLLVRRVLSEPGNDRVLLVDGGGSLHRALLGDQLAELARTNGWSAVVVLGAVRDADQLDELDFHVKALGTQPLKSRKQGDGERDVPVRLAETSVTAGHYVYSDADGLLVAPRRLHA
ncbi:MAG: ribonuclease E inhibitor RraA [Acidobacteria bacterium]|nr:MAG: ribonuclease E inhibitor RraA [Acidobacteriota bacterium]REK00156.1 MAG: ribonuclease E inhibitor RraA [Acidobacteriota bacterium]